MKWLKLELKKPIIEEIKGHLDGAKTVLVDYLGLTVEQDTNLRRQLRANNVIYKVYKTQWLILLSRVLNLNHWQKIKRRYSYCYF